MSFLLKYSKNCSALANSTDWPINIRWNLQLLHTSGADAHRTADEFCSKCGGHNDCVGNIGSGLRQACNFLDCFYDFFNCVRGFKSAVVNLKRRLSSGIFLTNNSLRIVIDCRAKTLKMLVFDDAGVWNVVRSVIDDSISLIIRRLLYSCLERNSLFRDLHRYYYWMLCLRTSRYGFGSKSPSVVDKNDYQQKKLAMENSIPLFAAAKVRNIFKNVNCFFFLSSALYSFCASCL